MYRFLLLFILYTVVAATVSSSSIPPQLDYDISTAKLYKCKKSQLGSRNATILHEDHEYSYIITAANVTTADCTFHSSLLHLVSQANEFKSDDDRITKRDTSDTNWFKSYHNLSSIYDWYHQLEYEYPDRVSIKTIGQTENGNPLIAVHLTNKEPLHVKKPFVYLQCLLHSREWVTGPVCMYISKALASVAVHSDSVLKKLLKLVEFVVIPIANPDGYELTWKNYPKYRLWRKNFSKSKTSSCVGVDLNRNFNINWSKHGSSSNPCDYTYHGERPESELEVSSITRYLKLHKPLLGSIDFHSFSQAVLYPNGWTSKPHSDSKLLKYIAQQVANVASSTKTNAAMKYKHEQMGSVYLASGTFSDWLVSEEFVNGNLNESGQKVTPVSLTIELPPKPRADMPMAGFMMPTKQIIPVCEGIFPAVAKFGSLLINNM